MIKICIAGATGRMGNDIINEDTSRGFQIDGAVEAQDNVNLNKSLREIGLCNSDLKLQGPSNLEEAVKNADIYISFTRPDAELVNIPVVAKLGKRIIIGTTGFASDQLRRIRSAITGRVPAVLSPNFALGVNVLFKLAQTIELFPPEYDISISEIHHTGKKDAPSGTAKKLSEVVSGFRGYAKVVYGREGMNPRAPRELEVSSLRVGGVPGIHDLIIAGPHEMLRIEHTAFSRSVFAQGALYAAEWLIKQTEPKIYSMEDVLSHGR